ncbi:ATP-binding cassette, subfamily C (CFTR/MRP), member 12 [Sarotherodon galilaeus]
MLLLLSFWMVTGLRAEDPTATYYRLKNSSVCLNVRKPPPYKHGEWKFNTIIITVDTEINPMYKDRVVYSAGNLSLCINNVADTDTGIYEVSYSRNFASVSEKHEVIVQDVVPRPVIIMSKLGSNQSAGLCSITVNCSIQDYWLWSICDEDGCRRSQKSFSEVNITIFTENRAVVCRGNNHVSTNKASENLTLCFIKSDSEHKDSSQPLAVIVRVTAVCVFLCGCFVFVAKSHCSKDRVSNQTQTAADLFIHSQPTEKQPQHEVSASSLSLSYENEDVIQSYEEFHC